MNYILIFNSVHKVMKAEKILKSSGVSFKTIPVPRQLSSDCGLAIRVTGFILEKILQILLKEPPEEIYLEENNLFRRVH